MGNSDILTQDFSSIRSPTQGTKYPGSCSRWTLIILHEAIQQLNQVSPKNLMAHSTLRRAKPISVSCPTNGDNCGDDGRILLGLVPVLLLGDIGEGKEQSLAGVATSLLLCSCALTSVAKYWETFSAAACITWNTVQLTVLRLWFYMPHLTEGPTAIRDTSREGRRRCKQ
jgi:hypothetical protein